MPDRGIRRTNLWHLLLGLLLDVGMVLMVTVVMMVTMVMLNVIMVMVMTLVVMLKVITVRSVSMVIVGMPANMWRRGFGWRRGGGAWVSERGRRGLEMVAMAGIGRRWGCGQLLTPGDEI